MVNRFEQELRVRPFKPTEKKELESAERNDVLKSETSSLK